MYFWNNIKHFCKMVPRTFSFMNYDSIGFDLDHTISLYKLNEIIQLQYKLLVDYLVNNIGYKREIFSSYLTSEDVDFIQRGLFLDFKKGNLLKIAHDGKILKGTHGTRQLSEHELTSIYGKYKKWELTDKLVTDMMSTWEPPLSDNMRSMMEFFDCQVSLIFGQIIDYIDSESSLKKPDSYDIWPSILDGIINMFEPSGGFYENLYSKPELYLRKCSPDVLNWMKNLRKENKLLFLLTGSRETEATFLADYCLGNDWKKYFDIIIYHAKKPGFFSLNRPFLERNMDLNICRPIELSQGNWNELYRLISEKTNLEKPKCIYIGDNLIQDVYATTLAPNVDAIALIEELSEDNNFKNYNNFNDHPYKHYVKSSVWGSYILSADGQTLTIWGSLMKKYSKFNIPSLDYVADKEISYQFNNYWPEKSNI